MKLDRFSQGPDDPQDSVQRWVGEVIVTYTVKIEPGDNCYSEDCAMDEAQRRVDEGVTMPQYEFDGELVDAREA